MSAKLKILVHEFVSAGGLGAPGADAAAAQAHAALRAQGISMRDALVDELAALAVLEVSASADAGAPLAGRSDCRWLPCPGGDDGVDWLAAVAPGYDRVWVIAPETEGLLDRLHDAVGAARWVGCDSAAIRVASSKSATRAVLGHCGIAVPWSWDAASPCAPSAIQAERWVVKPDDGAGGEDTTVFDDFARARRAAAARRLRGQPVTLEAWVEGAPMSLSALYRAGAAGELLSINAQAIRIETDGRLRYDGVRTGVHALHGALGRRLSALVEQIGFALPGLAGFVGVDFVLTEQGQPVVIEINPRLTCAYAGLSAQLGRNLAAEILGVPSLGAGFAPFSDPIAAAHFRHAR